MHTLGTLDTIIGVIESNQLLDLIRIVSYDKCELSSTLKMFLIFKLIALYFNYYVEPD